MPEPTPAVLVLGDTRGLLHHGCELVVEGLLQLIQEAGATKVDVVPGLQGKTDRADVRHAELVVLNGEGMLHHDRPVVEEALALAEDRRRRGLRTKLVNFSWFHNRQSSTQRLVAFEGLAPRDGSTAATLREAGHSFFLMTDVAAHQTLRMVHPPEQRCGIVVGDSTQPSVARALRELAQHRCWSLAPVLIPPGERSGRKARKIARRLQASRLVGSWILSDRYRGHRDGDAKTVDHLQKLGKAEGVVTGRFHQVCMALALGTPFLAVGSNTAKIEALCGDVGLDPTRRMVDPEEIANVHSVPPLSDQEQRCLDDWRRGLPSQWDRLRDWIVS